MMDERKNRLIWGLMLLIGSLGSVSLRNNPALGIMPFAVGVIQGVVYAFLLLAVRLSDRRIALGIAIIVPIFLWVQRFLDGFMIPVEMLAGTAMLGSMCLVLKKHWSYLVKVIVVAGSAFLVMLIGSSIAIRIVKEESFVRALIVAWNTSAYSGFSMLGAAAVCILGNVKEQTANPET